MWKEFLTVKAQRELRASTLADGNTGRFRELFDPETGFKKLLCIFICLVYPWRIGIVDKAPASHSWGRGSNPADTRS